MQTQTTKHKYNMRLRSAYIDMAISERVQQ